MSTEPPLIPGIELSRMTRAAVASVIFGFFVFIIGLFPAIINLDTKPGVGVLQLAVTLWGLGMMNAGAALWAYSERHRGAPRLLREDIGVRLIATGFVISAFSSLADVLGIGSHNAPRRLPYLGVWQQAGLAIGILVSVVGLLLYSKRYSPSSLPVGEPDVDKA
ncbi:hypothetical protein EMGBS3_12220 [Anaerolineaceae bacterium]|nr:hypothetical protein EMGBS3_12220 [Anaerolineaceae bacterium]